MPEDFFARLVRPASPNTWLVAPPGFMPAPDAIAPVFGVPLEKLEAAFTRAALASGRALLAASGEQRVHIVDRTRVLRFRDDVHVRFIALGPCASTLAAYSASRAGYWDFGANRRRLEAWLRETEAALNRTAPA